MIDELSTAGTETQLLALIRGLDRSRVVPHLCLLRGERPGARALEPADCPIIRLEVRSLHHPRTFVKALELGRFLRQRRIDVLQVYFQDSTYLGVPVGRLAGVPRIVRTRNNLGYWLTPAHRWLGWLSSQASDVMIANCEACRQAAIAGESADPRRVVVLENGVDISRFSAPTMVDNAGAPRIGIVANLRPVKSLDLFLRAAADIGRTHPDATFHIGGEGELRTALQTQAVELGLAGRVFLPGSIQDIPAFLAGLDIAVLCSRSEGMSNALLEYMAAGKAIIATAVGANSQLIETGVHGLLIPPGDAAALVAAIRSLLNDRELASQLGAAARLRARTHYSRAAMVRRFEDFYEHLASSSAAFDKAALSPHCA